jgi:hypothetical protein
LCEDGALFWDLDDTIISQVDGEPLVDRDMITSGGPFINGPVLYLESRYIAPAYFKSFSGKASFWSNAGTPGDASDDSVITGIQEASLAWGDVGISKDIFMVELFEFDNNYYMVCYGAAGRGTLASSVYFKTQIEPNLSSYTDSYYVVIWEDTNGNGHPDIPGTDTYTEIASGN